jgi:SAM-dependent methyltransferase
VPRLAGAGRHLWSLQRKLPERLRRPLAALGRRTPAGRKLLWREKGVGHELDFWRRWLTTKGLHWPEDYERRLDPEAPLDEPLIVERLAELGDDVSILDVGAGPLTILGKRHPGTTLRITPVDPLAREYDGLLAEFGVEPPIRTGFCPGERLLEQFEPGEFDVAYARNSVDHSLEAPKVVRNMVALVRPGGYVLLRHVRREGEHMSYSGFHQWNLDVEDGHLLLWNKVRRHDLTKELEPVATVRAYRDDDGEEDWVIAVIRKLEDAGGRPQRVPRSRTDSRT